MIVPGSANPLLMAQSADPLDELGKIERSLRLRRSASSVFTRVFGVATSQEKWTLHFWLKIGQPGVSFDIFTDNPGVGSDRAFIGLSSGAQLVLNDFNTGGQQALLSSGPLYRDHAGHLPVTIHMDNANATQADRVRFYIEDQRIAISGTMYATLTSNNFNFARAHAIGGGSGSISGSADCYLSNFTFVDGQNVAPTLLCQRHLRTGQWRPKTKAAIRAAVAAGGGPRNGWGANGFFLPFDDPTSLTTLGYDRSQSDTDTTGNNWTATNISLTSGTTYDSMLDTPTNNFATLNPLVPAISGSVFKNGNLQIGGTAGNFSRVVSTLPVSAGVWMWEALTPGNVGIVKLPLQSLTSNGSFGSGANEYAYRSDGQKNTNGTTSAYGAAFGSGDVITGLLDLNAGTLTFYKNGVSQGVAFSGLTGEFLVGMDQGSGGVDGHINFGQRPFSYPVAGAKTLCTKNLPVKPAGPMKSSDAFVAVTAAGASIQSTLAAARAGWPGYIDIIKRTDSGEGWRWIFSDDPTNYLDSAGTAAKAAVPAFSGTNYLGISLKVSAQNGVATGRLTHTNGVADVVTDGLGNTRKMVILKNEATGSWYVYHPDLTAGRLLYLESTSAENIDSSISSVTASGFTVAAALASGTYRWIAFADVEGAIKVGSYIGNGLADGPFDHRGHVPVFEINKTATNGSSSWFAFSNAFESNQETSILLPNSTSGVLTGYFRDSVSNGRKWRIGGADPNTASSRNVYVSFAAFPFRYANAR